MKISYTYRILLQIKKIYINSTEKEWKKPPEKHTEYNKIRFFYNQVKTKLTKKTTSEINKLKTTKIQTPTKKLKNTTINTK